MTTEERLDQLNALLSPRDPRSREELLSDLTSGKPTRHLVRTASGTRYFTHCALDTLMFQGLLGEDLEIESTPPGGAEPVRYAVRQGAVSGPASLVVSVPTEGGQGPTRTSFCPYSNAFPDEATYRRWAASSPVPTRPATLEEALELARGVVEHRLALDADRGRGRGCC